MKSKNIRIPLAGFLFLALFAAVGDGQAATCKGKPPTGVCECQVLWPPGGHCPSTSSCLGGPADEKITCKSKNGCVIISGAGNDTVIGTEKRDFICTGSGNDTIYSGTSSIGDDDYVDAGSGNDKAQQ